MNLDQPPESLVENLMCVLRAAIESSVSVSPPKGVCSFLPFFFSARLRKLSSFSSQITDSAHTETRSTNENLDAFLSLGIEKNVSLETHTGWPPFMNEVNHPRSFHQHVFPFEASGPPLPRIISLEQNVRKPPSYQIESSFCALNLCFPQKLNLPSCSQAQL